MDREDDKQLWDILGRIPEPKLSPFFARNVARSVRQEATRLERMRGWFSWRRLAAACAVAMVVIGTAITTHHPVPQRTAVNDSDVVAKIMRDRWMAMPPATRQNFQRNAERWLRMSPAERNVLRERENLRRQTIRRETEAALRDSGLHLNPQERAQFESRYIQERRNVERTLRQQIETERQQQLPALIQQLKKEFQIDQPTKGSSTKSVESPKPKK